MTRRRLLGALAASAAAAQAGIGLAVAPAPQQWDKTVSFLIVGTGFAGLAAALESHYAGLKNVLVVDKMAVAGGNSAINGGAIAAADTDMQRKDGIKDSADLMFKDIMRAGGYINHPDLARRIADGSAANFYWLRDEVGVQFEAVTYHGGHSVKRSHSVTMHMGAGFINPMLDKCRQFGIPIQLRTIVDDFVVEDGRVVGVKARVNHRDDKPESGRPFYIRAEKGVLLATGGFSRNVKMRMSHDPRLGPSLGSTNHRGATGEMIQAAQRLGANTVHMDWIQMGPWTSPDEGGFGIAPLFVEPLVGYGCMVDIATGKRFINETGNRKVRADAIVALGHPTLIYACEENVMKQALRNMTRRQLDIAIKGGVIGKFATLKEMADFYKIPYDALKAQNDLMNQYIRARKDPDFKCRFFEDSVPNEKGPFYAARLWPRVHHTMGGIEINDKAQVLDVSGNVIPGLYAAGEVTGGVHGMVRLGTVAVADCMIFGRAAVRAALADK